MQYWNTSTIFLIDELSCLYITKYIVNIFNETKI